MRPHLTQLLPTNASAQSIDVSNGLTHKDLAVEEYGNAVVMQLQHSQENSKGNGWDFNYGGVYTSKGQFIEMSALDRPGTRFVTAYPPETVHSVNPIRKDCEAVYCGPLLPHFGHFLVEGMARLWWGIKNDFHGKYLFQSVGGAKLPAFASYIFESLSVLDRVDLVQTPIEYNTVFVPEVGLRLGKSAHYDVLIPFKKIREAHEKQLENSVKTPLYLSRLSLNGGQSIGETSIQKIMKKNGYRTIFPEKMTMREQIINILAASDIAGICGSAMHLLLFREQATATYVLKGPALSPTYPVIDRLTSSTGSYVMGTTRQRQRLGKQHFGQETPTLLDPSLFVPGLQELGFDCTGIDFQSEKALQKEYLETYYKNHASVSLRRNDPAGFLKSSLKSYAQKFVTW